MKEGNNVLLTLFVITVVCFSLAYKFYGGFQSRYYGLDPERTTPAKELQDNIDYCPAHPAVLMGHHFASIAGAGPVTGPILASVFGWVPVLLWLIIGGLFFGAVQDFASMYASVKNKGRTIGYIIEEYIQYIR